MEKKAVIEKLLKAGAKPVKNLVVKGVNVVPQENYIRVSLSLDKPVRGFIDGEDGAYKEGETKVIFISLYSLTAQLRDDSQASFAVNHILKNPEAMQVILAGAKINILQEDVKEGVAVVNPWSDQEKEGRVYDHDIIVNHVVDIALTERAYQMLDRLALALMGL